VKCKSKKKEKLKSYLRDPYLTLNSKQKTKLKNKT